MLKKEAEERVIDEWFVWARSQGIAGKGKGTDALQFFAYLRRDRRHLLNFTASGDKWQIVHGWLQFRGLVSG
jgi:hypothetical protein